MQEQADAAEGDVKQKIDADIKLLQVNRKNFADAIDAIEDAELSKWESKKTLIEQARDRLKE